MNNNQILWEKEFSLESKNSQKKKKNFLHQKKKRIEDVEEDIEALVTVTLEGTIKSASNTFWTLLGYTSEELEGNFLEKKKKK